MPLLTLAWFFFAGMGLIEQAWAVSGKVKMRSMACYRSGIKRDVRVLYGKGSANIGCEVRYRKRQEGAWRLKKLWSAEFEAGYCDKRASELITRLENWGWTCRGKVVR